MKTYEFDDFRLTAETPVEVGRDQGHFWFGGLHSVGPNDVLCGVVLSADVAQGQWPARIFRSRDGGRSWQQALEIGTFGHESTVLDDGRLLLMPYETWPLSPGDKRNAKANGTLFTCDDDGVSAEPGLVKFLGFDRDLADYHEDELTLLANGNLLRLEDGSLFCTPYGKFAGDEHLSVFGVTSDDGGFTWRFRSVVASCDDIPHAGEGANESNTARLEDGRLLCVYRVASGVDFHKSYSSDSGHTWTKPERIEGAWSVEPRMVRLENGAIVLTGGRPGLFCWVCTDGKGEQWTRFNLAAHHNELVADESLHYLQDFCDAKQGISPAQSTSYTGMKAIGPGEALICYDRLANGWDAAPGPWGDASSVFTVRVKVETA